MIFKHWIAGHDRFRVYAPPPQLVKHTPEWAHTKTLYGKRRQEAGGGKQSFIQDRLLLLASFIQDCLLPPASFFIWRQSTFPDSRARSKKFVHQLTFRLHASSVFGIFSVVKQRDRK
jgi:hypothetical protein